MCVTEYNSYYYITTIYIQYVSVFVLNRARAQEINETEDINQTISDEPINYIYEQRTRAAKNIYSVCASLQR